jgi:hypothetical protein
MEVLRRGTELETGPRSVQENFRVVRLARQTEECSGVEGKEVLKEERGVRG